MNEQLSKSTLFNFFAGHASPLEKRLINEWLKDTDNQELYFEWMEEWERKNPQYIPDTRNALNQFVARIDANIHPVVVSPKEPVRSNHYVWLFVAASLSLLATLTVYIEWDLLRYKTYSTAYGEIESFILDDGSKISLNANSSLRVSRFGFGKSTREVFLKGEAEFSVVHTKDDKKFLVHTQDQLEVEVVGTEFVVYSRERGSRVVLSKGKVLLRSLADTTRRAISIMPGEVVTIQKGAFKKLSKQRTTTHTDWKDHRFTFDHTPVQEIAYQVEERFGIKLLVTDTILARRELTGTYQAENAKELLDVLVRVLDVKITQNDQKLLLQPR
jgi:ferric-dicitrate binding protein FerR (iron transport regulator)